MASLQDQLLQAGLSNATKVKKIKADKRKQVRQQQKQKIVQVDEAKEQLKKSQAERVEKDRVLNQKRNAVAEEKQIAAQIKQLIEQSKQAQDPEGVAFNFNDQNKVKTVYVSEAIKNQISWGRLAVVKNGQAYELIPRQVAEKIKARDPACIIVLNDHTDQTDENDPYADFQIPDDLIW